MFELNEYVKIIGVGSGGIDIVNGIIEQNLQYVMYYAMDTDSQALLKSRAQNLIQIGERLMHGQGTNGKLEDGLKAADESQEAIKAALNGANMVFIIAGMGGGTGTGAAQTVVECAKELGALTICLVTTPFGFEGEEYSHRAESGVENLIKHADSVIVLSNDKLMEFVNEKLLPNQAFRISGDAVGQLGGRIVKNIISLASSPDHLVSILMAAGRTFIGMGTGSGENGAVSAVEEALEVSIIDANLSNARNVLLRIAGYGTPVSKLELEKAVNAIRVSMNPDVNIVLATVEEESLNNSVRVTVIATDFDKVAKGQLVENGISYKQNIYKQVIETCLKRIKNSATGDADCAVLIKEMRMVLKEMS